MRKYVSKDCTRCRAAYAPTSSRQKRCQACRSVFRNEEARRKYKKDPYVLRARARKDYASNIEARRRRAREYAEQHRDESHARSAKWDAEHRELRLERTKLAWKRWEANNPKKASQIKQTKSANRRARKLNQFVESVDPETLYFMWGGMCGVCKKYIEGDFHIDHWIPLSKGGLHGYINCRPAHPRCNLRKGSTIIEEPRVL